jgi:hypothetical protein
MAESELLRAALVVAYPSTRSTGTVVRAFLTGLREGILLGIQRRDGTVLVPPTEYDPVTSEPLTEMVEVGQAGVVETWTWVDPPRPQSPWEVPHALAMIRLDGADTAMLHGVLVDSPTEMTTGMRVRAVWADQRVGHIADLDGFRPEAS